HSGGVARKLVGPPLAATAAVESETAVACAEEAMEAYGDGEPTFPAMGAGMALAAALVEVDEPPRAAHVLLAAGGGEELERVPACWRSAGFEVLTRALLASGRRDE